MAVSIVPSREMTQALLIALGLSGRLIECLTIHVEPNRPIRVEFTEIVTDERTEKVAHVLVAAAWQEGEPQSG